MKLYCIAGEDSGDLHGSNLLLALQKQHTDIQFFGIGGDKMQAAGMRLSAHIRNTNFMGFWEVFKNIFTIRKLFKTVENDLLNLKPDAIILIDYPGFNLRIAKFAHKHGIKVFYYISPQLWAWKKGRVKQIKAYVDKMFVILPFEKEFYAKEGVEVEFVGHPLLDAIANQKIDAAQPISSNKKIIALLPGSRTQEIKTVLPEMLKTIPHFPDYQFIIAGAPSKDEPFYQAIVGNANVEIYQNRTYELLSKASFALVTSGTATLETALFRVPEVVCYKGSPISFWIGKHLVEVKYISLVNLILDKKAVTELIQYDLNTENLVNELNSLINNSQNVQNDYELLYQKLGSQGASERCAKTISHLLSE